MGHVVAFTGGGTGGHVFPGLAVIEALRDYDITDVCWIGSARGVEREIAESWGVPFYAVPAGKLRRYFSLYTFLDAFRVPAGFLMALYRLRKISPAFVFSKGGYVTVPVIAAARVLGIPCYTHDSDLDPGLATKLNSRMVDKVLVAYEQSKDYFASGLRAKVLVTGNPVRRAISAGDATRGREFLGLGAERRPVLLFLGGSLGATEINDLVGGALARLRERCCVVHQTGKQGGNLDEVRTSSEAIAEPTTPSYYAAPFFASEYPDILAAADLVVCRAGAGTVWELAVTGKPALLIPLGLQGSRGDQIRNAELYAAGGAAKVLPSGKTTVETLLAEIWEVLDDPDALPRMSAAARSFAGADAAMLIAGMIRCEIYGTLSDGDRGWYPDTACDTSMNGTTNNDASAGER
ncbi:MAG: undecaprenyldiphospho-muramoylpentapeptide beta-N-acetylglucosaminyltransferase [Spirochaetaceae bacterium]|nr:MAG: undecaprenyldiphospho-muramoylpentapeptide beta-N-acetylglucosaminyltransferase [Spirochaetaceae bacterium]